jgi:ribosomal protein RSM22 (predicted rRNA methylase)
MNPELPPSVRSAIDALTQGVSRNDLARRAEVISQGYRAHQRSQHVIETRLDAIAYTLSRAPATFAALMAAFDALRQVDPSFAPKTMIDVGSGPGTASWAAAETWPSLEHMTMFDRSEVFLALATEFSSSSDRAAIRTARHFQSDLAASTVSIPKTDLVVAGYALSELPSTRAARLASTLLESTNDALVIVEPGTPAGYQRVIDCRTVLIAEGAHIAAPCPHDKQCPLAAPDWCHFSQRLPRSRDHLALKDASVPFEDERFSYVIARKHAAPRTEARNIAQPKVGKVLIELPLCTRDGLRVARIARRDKGAYARAKRMRWGDVYHLDSEAPEPE